jgi:hypothetical protein
VSAPVCRPCGRICYLSDSERRCLYGVTCTEADIPEDQRWVEPDVEG